MPPTRFTLNRILLPEAVYSFLRMESWHPAPILTAQSPALPSRTTSGTLNDYTELRHQAASVKRSTLGSSEISGMLSPASRQLIQRPSTPLFSDSSRLVFWPPFTKGTEHDCWSGTFDHFFRREER